MRVAVSVRVLQVHDICDICRCTQKVGWQNFSKVSSMVISYSTFGNRLTFENVLQFGYSVKRDLYIPKRDLHTHKRDQ